MVLSVVIPTYNRPNCLYNVLIQFANSGLSQKEYEIIVSDDADTPTMRAKNQQVIEIAKIVGITNIVHVCNKYPKAGPAGNRQNGLDNATGEWVLFMDDDDELILNEYGYTDLVYIVDFLDKNKQHMIACVTTDCKAENKNGDLVPFTNKDDYMKCLTHGKLYNRSFLNMYHIKYNVSAEAHEDIDFNYKVFCVAIRNNYSIKDFTESQNYYFYRFKYNPNSLSRQEGFYYKYITQQPKWFLEKFDAPLEYATNVDPEMSDREIIFNYIHNELFYAFIAFITMKKWGEETQENIVLYMDFFEKCKEAFKGKLDISQREIIEKALKILLENKQMDIIEDCEQYIDLIKEYII